MSDTQLAVKSTLTTAQIREAVWEWLNVRQLIHANPGDIVFSEEKVTAHILGKTWPRR